MVNKFDQIYKSKLDSIIADTSRQERDWLALNLKLEKREKKRVIFYILIFATIGILLLIYSCLGSFIYRHNTSDKKIAKGFKSPTQAHFAQHNNILLFPTTLQSINQQQNISFNKGKKNKAIPVNSGNVIIETKFPNIYRNTEIQNSLKKETLPVNSISASKESLGKLVNTSFQYSNFSNFQTEQLRSTEEIPRLKKGINYLTFPRTNIYLSQNVRKPSYLSFKFSYGKYYNVLQKHPNTDELSHVEEIISRNYLGNTMQSSFVYSLKEKFRFSVGLSHSIIRYDAYHKLNIKAHELTISDPSVNSQRRYTFNYNTSDGKTYSSLLVSFFDVTSGQHISKSDSFDFSMKINKSIKKLSLPLLLEGRLVNKGNLSAYLQLGLSLNYAYKIKTQIINSDETCKELCLVNGFEPKISSGLISSASIELDGLIGLALEYKLSPRFSVGLNPQSSINIHSPSLINRYGLSSYVLYHFNK